MESGKGFSFSSSVDSILLVFDIVQHHFIYMEFTILYITLSQQIQTNKKRDLLHLCLKIVNGRQTLINTLKRLEIKRVTFYSNYYKWSVRITLLTHFNQSINLLIKLGDDTRSVKDLRPLSRPGLRDESIRWSGMFTL